jgi:archaellum component FlaG (FlaF/FlaG flagellin family)
MSKKSQGLSINTIVVAVIALIVIVVIVAMLTGKLGNFSKSVQDSGDPTKTCLEQSGQILVAAQNECSDNAGFIQITSSDTISQGDKCCKALPP